MKIALYSDLHLETLRRLPELDCIPEPREPVDLIILAGDIHQGTKGLDALARMGRGHIYVSGNHEYYHNDIEVLDQKLVEKAAELGLHYLQRSQVIIQGVRFLGTTLWTDYNIQPGWRFGAELVAKAFLPDYKLIRFRGDKFTPAAAIGLHETNVNWLASKLDEPFEGKTVIITHHAPHPGSIHPRFALSPINAAFVSDLSNLMGKADLWLHGHMHDSFDYNVHTDHGQTRILANPRGYV
ncbi:MAG: metallophosphoesterase, partial [Limnobacter sp.]|nr:metallophosphoesterase [Limnobacter sp.]